MSSDELELYFESEKYSGGGDVDNVNLFPEATGAIVYFQKETGKLLKYI